jgi:hypothetical protein
MARQFDESKVKRNERGQFARKAGAAADPFVQRIADEAGRKSAPKRRKRRKSKATPARAPRGSATAKATKVAAKVDAFVQRIADQAGSRRPLKAAARTTSAGRTINPDVLANIGDPDFATPAALRVRYKYGQCHALAQAIHDATGWPMEVWRMEQGGNEHAVVRMPDGRLLDVEGVHTVDDVRDRYYYEPTVTPFRNARKLADWDPPIMDATTRAVAAALVNSVKG